MSKSPETQRPEVKRTPRKTLFRAESKHSWETRRACAPHSTEQKRRTMAPLKQVRGHMRSQEEGAADVALEGSRAIGPDKTGA